MRALVRVRGAALATGLTHVGPSIAPSYQEHMRAAQSWCDAKGGPLKMPAMIRFWVEDGRITRLEEYLDTRQAMVLYATD